MIIEWCRVCKNRRFSFYPISDGSFLSPLSQSDSLTQIYQFLLKCRQRQTFFIMPWSKTVGTHRCACGRKISYLNVFLIHYVWYEQVLLKATEHFLFPSFFWLDFHQVTEINVFKRSGFFCFVFLFGRARINKVVSSGL